MTTCRGCGALVQPEWDRCKICGFDGSEPDDASEAARGRRARKARKADRARPVADERPPPSAVPAGAVAVATPPRSEPPREPKPARTRQPAGQAAIRRTTSNREAPVWLVGAALVAVIVGCLVIIFKDPADSSPPPSDVPAAESDPEGGAPVWQSLGEWDDYDAPEGGLSVELPGPPLQEIQQMYVPNIGQVDLNRATVVTTGVTVTVGWGVVPENVQDRPDLVLDGMIRAEADEVHGEVAAQKEVTVDGMPAVRARVASPIGEVRMVAVAGPEKVYLLQADAGDDGTIYLQRLIDTFES